ncbi:MAG: two-component system response regulator [Gammaproteobacteria bacterium CG22_combo_CG10-13_8_21_14_all_40_8]|nr:MAG: two-component system response regulator [Gammaproteobacteria bacterium CG22_combo_CG10-13_8_21_14_all_40_8]
MQQITIQDLSIVLVEPSVTQRKLIANQLDAEGVASIITVDNGQQALQKIKQTLPDLVISSMYLEDMTGTDLVFTIRKDIHLASIPFMLISSEKRFDLLDPIRQAGVVAILPKPFNPIDLTRALQSTLVYTQPSDLLLAQYRPEELRVLVVDDSRMARRHIQRVLSDMGLNNMQTAENGKVAMNMFQQEVFDLVVTDLNMPEMDGNELVDFIRKKSSRPDTPILMVTSEDSQARLANVERSGVSAICDKPFDPTNVRNLLAHILS